MSRYSNWDDFFVAAPQNPDQDASENPERPPTQLATSRYEAGVFVTASENPELNALVKPPTRRATSTVGAGVFVTTLENTTQVHAGCVGTEIANDYDEMETMVFSKSIVSGPVPVEEDVTMVETDGPEVESETGGPCAMANPTSETVTDWGQMETMVFSKSVVYGTAGCPSDVTEYDVSMGPLLDKDPVKPMVCSFDLFY